MKAFYCGGGESNYSYTDQFTTAPACPPMTNLAVQTFAETTLKLDLLGIQQEYILLQELH